MRSKIVLAVTLCTVSLLIGNLSSRYETLAIHTGYSHLIPEVQAQTTEAPEVFEAAAEAVSEATVSDEIILPAETIFIKPQQPQRIKDLLKLYQDQVEKYAVSEREYRTAKAQFFKLTTLQSLEEAITKTRQVMLDRDDVLITYAELVRAHLQETDGIEISLKTYSDTELETLIITLKEHREKVEGTKDREALKQRVIEFLPISKSINGKFSLAVALISLGDLQTVYDKNEIIYREIKQLHIDTPTSALRQEERERAYREIDSAIENVRGDIEEVRLEIARVQGKESNYLPNNRTKFRTIASGNKKVLEYLRELLLELT